MIILPNLKGIMDKAKVDPYKILTGGNFTSYNENTINYIICLNDNTFNTGTGFNNAVNAIAIQSDGKILCGGSFTNYNGLSISGIVRLNSDGTINNSFAGAISAGGTVNAIAIQSDGKIICGGSFFNGITRLNTDGTSDSSFFVSRGFNAPVNTIAVESDGKIICGGSFTYYYGSRLSNRYNYIIRIQSSGAIDSNPISIPLSGFSGSFNNIVNVIVLQPDGKIVCGGNFTTFKNISTNYIARLNTDGSIDSSFIAGGFDNAVKAIVIQPDGKLLVGGNFISYNGITINRIARLNTDGALDSSFTTGTGFDNTVNAIAIQSDGKIICGGSFTTYNGTSRGRIARLNTDGTIDSSFIGGTGFNNAVNALAIK